MIRSGPKVSLSKLPSKYKQICAILDADEHTSTGKLTQLTGVRGQVLWNYRSKWKTNHLGGAGSQPNQTMNVRFKTHPDRQHWSHAEADLPSCLDRAKYADVTVEALKQGWLLSDNPNHMLTWKDSLGTIKWFVSGTLIIHANRVGRMSATTLMLKTKLLVRHAFADNELITDNLIYGKFIDSIQWYSSHDVYYIPGLKSPLPNVVIQTPTMKAEGRKIKVGDLSDPYSIEEEWVSDPVIKGYKKIAEDTEKKYMKVIGDLTVILEKTADDKVEKSQLISVLQEFKDAFFAAKNEKKPECHRLYE